jgi:FMN phosphatase YigB (HAD superfamily)
MSRKPGQPADYVRQIYADLLQKQQITSGGAEKYPEASVDRLWEAFVKRLLQKDYTFDAGFFGSLNEYSRKVAYFFHASLQGVAAQPGAIDALRSVAGHGLRQGLLGNGQCFSAVQLQRALADQDAEIEFHQVIHPDLITLSYEVRGRQPSERLYRQALGRLSEHGVKPDQVLHVGSRVVLDVIPAKRLGMKTALFAGDRSSLQATAEQLKDANSRPDVLLTELTQVTEVVG